MPRNAQNIAYLASRSRQGGAATMIVAVVLLLLITMVGMYTSRAVVLEQKIGANDVRSRQAFEAAESGINVALGYIGGRGGADRDDNDVLDSVFDTDGDGVGDVDTTTFENFSTVTVTLSGAFPQVGIEAVGISDDRTATRTIRAVGSVADSLPNAPQNPLTAKGTVNVDGSATIHNPEGSSTIWSGTDVQLGSNNATATFIADPTDASYPTCLETSMTCGTTRSSSKNAIGLDVIEYDSSLRNLTAEELFRNFFGLSSANYRASRVTLEVDAANANNLASDEASPGIDLGTGEVIWVEGTTTLQQNTTVGCEVRVTGGNVCPADSVDPSITIINGDLILDGTPHFYGLVYVIGNLQLSGNSTVHGAMISTGGFQNGTGGSLDIWYNSDLLEWVRFNGFLASAPGSWHDW